jgi:uncharacterized DUF497 family protein
MSDSRTTATPEKTNAAPTTHPPVRENQSAVEAEVEQAAITSGTAELNAGQWVMRAIGETENGSTIVVVFTMRGEQLRIVSARKQLLMSYC